MSRGGWDAGVSGCVRQAGLRVRQEGVGRGRRAAAVASVVIRDAADKVVAAGERSPFSSSCRLSVPLHRTGVCAGSCCALKIE